MKNIWNRVREWWDAFVKKVGKFSAYTIATMFVLILFFAWFV